MAIANTFHRAATVDRAVAIHGDVRHTQVNPKHAFNVDWLRRLDIADRQKVERAANVGQIGFTMPRLEQGPLARTTHERDRLPAVKRPDRHGWLFQVPTQDTVIVGDAPIWSEGALMLAVQLVGVGNFADTAYGQLRGKPECLTNVGIRQFVEVKLLEGLGLPCGCADAVARGIGPFKRALQGVGLLRRWKEFELGDQLHSFIVLKGCDMYRHERKEDGRIPPPPKERRSPALLL